MSQTKCVVRSNRYSNDIQTASKGANALGSTVQRELKNWFVRLFSDSIVAVLRGARSGQRLMSCCLHDHLLSLIHI